MKQERKRRKKESNLGCIWETVNLVSRYRIFKSIEWGAHKFAPNFDEATLEEINGDYKLAQDLFINYALDMEHPLPNDYFKSNKAGIFASLYRILEKEDLLLETIAIVVCLWLKGNRDESVVKDYEAHLRYYINHPEIRHEYKGNKIFMQNIEEAKPIYNKLLHILKNKGNLKIKEKEDVEKLVEDLKKYDEKFIIRTIVLEDFFNFEKGSKLSLDEKINIALKVGALDTNSICYYDEDGNMI